MPCEPVAPVRGYRSPVHGRRDLVVPSVVAVVVMYVMTAVHLHDSGVLCF